MKNLQRSFKKVFSIMLIMMLTVLTFNFSACGVNNVGSPFEKIEGEMSNNSKTLEIYVYDAGYGIKWLDEMIKAFNEKTDNEYDIGYIPETGELATKIQSKIMSGPNNNTIDLFIGNVTYDSFVEQGRNAVAGYSCCLENLDDVYNYTLPGEGKTIEEKMWSDYSSQYLMNCPNVGEHYYAFPWASGTTGMLYNKSIFDSVGLTSEPRTTEELLQYAESIKSAGLSNTYAITFSAEADYMEYLFHIWWAQYETMQGIDNFYNCKTSKEQMFPTAESALGIFDQEGILAGLSACADLLNPNKGYAAYGDEALTFMRAQGKLINKQAAMMANGDWFENELLKSEGGMSAIYTKNDLKDIRMMKTPIISAISDKLSYYDESDSWFDISSEKQALYDAKLREIVDYVDGVTNVKPDFATQDDINIVSEARRVIYSVGSYHACAIPVYATAKNLAKEFLKFMASDEGCAIYQKYSNGAMLPFDYDYKAVEGYDDYSVFAKTKMDVIANAITFCQPNHYATFLHGKLAPYKGINKMAITFGSADSQTRRTAKQIVEYTKNNWDVGTMARLLENAGLI